MKYCSRCGSPMEDSERFCNRCGAKAGSGTAFRRTTAQHEPPVEPAGKLGCELAYAGTLFWLPLLICPEEKNADFCANQGLWVLILSVAACVGIRLLGGVNEVLSGGFLGVITSGIYSFLFILFLALMLYLVWNCVKNAMAIHRGENPKSILFFDRIRIIKERV